jgi:hypothetical protein
MDYAYLIQSKKDRAEAYKFYSAIESYPERYPSVYGNIKLVGNDSNSLEVKMLAPLERSSENELTARFTFVPQTEIKYEVTTGYGKGEIQNSIIIKEPSEHALKNGFKCEIEVNHLPLDIMGVDPGQIDADIPIHRRYLENISYLLEQDRAYLEGIESLGEVRDCPSCGAKKSVGPIGTSGRTENTRTIKLLCLKCGKSFDENSIALP